MLKYSNDISDKFSQSMCWILEQLNEPTIAVIKLQQWIKLLLFHMRYLIGASCNTNKRR